MADEIDPPETPRKPGIKLSDLKNVMPQAKTELAADELRKMLGPTTEMQERIKNLAGIGAIPQMSKLMEQLTAQNRAIEAFRAPSAVSELMKAANRATAIPQLPDPLKIESPSFDLARIELPPNPLIETNKRLASIEDRFDKMQEIAAQGAEIATGLQVAAAEFLTKFDEVATKNDRTAGRAVWVAIAAAVFAVAVPLVQTLYAEVWKAPNDAQEMRKIVSEMKSEIATLRETQQKTAEQITTALTSGNKDMSETLKAIRDTLANRPSDLPSIPRAE